jgi:hypothetical protein
MESPIDMKDFEEKGQRLKDAEVCLITKQIPKIKEIYDALHVKYPESLGELKVTDIKNYRNGRYILIENGGNPVYDYLMRIIPDMRGVAQPLYHFKSYDIAKKILETNSIQVSDMMSNFDNDFAEYTEFFRRIGMVRPFTTGETPSIARGCYYDTEGKYLVDHWKQSIFILCLTENGDEPKFWKEYGGDENAEKVRLKMEFDLSNLPKTEGHELKVNFRKVCYDSGYKFDPILELNNTLRLNVQLELEPKGFTRFSTFYKRKKYECEKETRLSLDFTDYSASLKSYVDDLLKQYPVKMDKKRRYIDLSADSRYIKWKISEITCSPSVTESHFNEIERLGKMHNPKMIIDRK